MKIQTVGNHGNPNLSVVGTWEYSPITIYDTMYAADKQGPKDYQKKSTSRKKHITNPTVTPEDEVVQTAQKLIEALKGKLKEAIDKSGINQINKMDAIFNMTTEKFQH